MLAVVLTTSLYLKITIKIFVFFFFLEISLTIPRDKSAEPKKLQDNYATSPSSVDPINIYGIAYLFAKYKFINGPQIKFTE